MNHYLRIMVGLTIFCLSFASCKKMDVNSNKETSPENVIQRRVTQNTLFQQVLDYLENEKEQSSLYDATKIDTLI